MSDDKNTSTSISAMAAPTLTTLPPELQLDIIRRLNFLDVQLLRSTNMHFRFFINAPTQSELHAADDDPCIKARGLLYCNPCNRFRHADKFSTKMQKRSGKGNKGGATTRFCIECGCRRRTGTSKDLFKYVPGARWESQGVFYIRCFRCDHCRQAPSVAQGAWSKDANLCLVCIPQVEQEKEWQQRERAESNAEHKRRRENPTEEEKQIDAARAAEYERFRALRGPRAVGGTMLMSGEIVLPSRPSTHEGGTPPL